jgi:hypothetical protein
LLLLVAEFSLAGFAAYGGVGCTGFRKHSATMVVEWPSRGSIGD